MSQGFESYQNESLVRHTRMSHWFESYQNESLFELYQTSHWFESYKNESVVRIIPEQVSGMTRTGKAGRVP